MRLLVSLLLLCAAAPAQQRIEETFFLSAPNFLTGRFREPILGPVAVGADADGSVVLLGRAVGAELPVFNAAQPNWASGLCSPPFGTFACSDFYLARFLPYGQGPAYMTYLGGPNQELPLDLAVDRDGTAYILGRGALDWMPVTADLSEPDLSPDGSDPFVLTVSRSGDPDKFVSLPRTPLSYSSVEVDATGAVYLAGTVHSGVEPINGFGNEGPEISLYRSSDGGDVWIAQPTEAPSLVSKLIAVESNGNTQLFAYSREGGVFVSDDQGGAWRLFAPRVEPPSATGSPPPDLAVAPGETPTAFAFSSGGGEIYRSSGGPFEPLFAGFSVAVFEPDPRLIRATTAESLLTSLDGGATWESLPFPAGFVGQNSHLWLHPTQPEVVYMQAVKAADFQRILVVSEDGGANWRRIDEPLRELIQSDRIFSFEIRDIEISSLGTLFAATSTGLFISNDGGLSWAASNEGFPTTDFSSTLDIEIDASDPLRLILVAFEDSFIGGHPEFFLLTSTDGGRSWRPADQPPANFNGVIAADPLQTGGFYALGGFRNFNAFVMKLPPSLDRIEFFSIYGGSEREEGFDVAIDSSGRAYLSGSTNSADLSATDGGFQSNLPGPHSAFIVRFSADGSSTERATYLGGSFANGANAIALDPQGFVYVTGSTGIDGFPLVNPARTADSPQPLGSTVAFLAKLDPDLREVVYSTLLGAKRPFPAKQRLAVDALGRAHVLRHTGPVDPPAEGGGLIFGGSEAFAIERFSAEGVPEDVLYFDGAAAMALDADDQLVVVGNGTDGLVPGRAVRLPQDSGEASIRPPLPAAYLARAAPNRPAPYVEAVVNAASFRSGPASPGELVSLFGRDLGPESGAAFELVDGRLPSELGGTQVLFGETRAPLLFSGAGQVNAATPFSLETGGLVTIRVRRDGAESNLIWQTIAAADPGVFTLNGMRVGDAAVLNQDGTINSPANPAVPGSVISIFATGGGKLTPALEAEEVAGPVLSRIRQLVKVELAGLDIGKAIYAGSAPGLVAGVLQVNAVVPEFGAERSIIDLKIVVGQMKSGPLQAFVSIAGVPSAP